MRGASEGWIARLLSRRAGRAAEAGRARLDEWMRAGYEHHKQGRLAEAGHLYRKILESDPRYADASYFLGVIAEGEGRNEDAVTRFRDAVAAKPDEPNFLFALGTQLYRARQFDEAVKALGSGLAMRPDNADAQNDLGASLMELGRWEEARAVLEPLVAANAEFFPTRYNLGNLYRQQGRVEDAIAQHRRAIELRPDHLDSHRCLLYLLNYSDQYDAAAVFAEHRRFGERYARAAPGPEPDRRWPRRLRVGYLSPDFRTHVVSSFIGPVLARHDREKFEIFCYYTHPEQDEVTRRLRSYAEHWSDCAGISDDALADRIRGHRIDILVDLAGHTWGERIAVLALKPAPVQVTYLGYPNTTGLRAVDYRITDVVADPPGDADARNVERLIRLARCFLCYRPGPDLHDPGPLPAQSNGYVTFGCFNNFLKLSGSFLDTAAQVLNAVPGSRLVLKGKPLDIPPVAQKVRERFAAAGVAPERLILRGWNAAFEDHLGAYGEIDIALDSFPYNGTTTTCEAIWMGVPVVTLQGDRHAARVGASLLHAVGLDEFVARDGEEFVRIAARLAADLPRLAGLREGMRRRMRESPLMDEAGFVRELERSYLEIWQAKLDAVVPLPDDAEALTRFWNRCHETGEHGAAIEALGRAIAADGTVARHHYMLGCTLQDAGRLPEAVDAYRRALALEPGLARAQNNLGCLLEAAGDAQGAMQCYEAAVRAEPGLANALYNRGNMHKLRGDAAQREPLRLHVGGKQRKDGWRILNAQSAEGVDFVGDCCDLGRFPDGSVDEIYASHVLEHLGYVEKLPRALAGFHRVLGKGGALRISVPDFDVLCRLFIDTRLQAEERFHVMRMAFGDQTDAYDFHCVGLTWEFLGGYLQAAGFGGIERVAEFGLFDDASALRFRGNLISLNVIARK